MRTLFLPVFMSLSIFFAGAEDLPPLEAKVLKAKGLAELVDGEKRSLLKPGQTLKEQQIVRTGSDGFALLEVAGAKIAVFSNSEVCVKRKDQEKGSRILIDQAKGFSWSKVKKIKTSEDTYEVKTPSAVAGVRGTAFGALASPEGDGFCVCEGLVKVTRGEDSLELAQGQFASAGSGDDQKLERLDNDSTLLQKPDRHGMNCMLCHQGGRQRDGLYGR